MLQVISILHYYQHVMFFVGAFSGFNDCLSGIQLVNQCLAFQLEQRLSMFLFIQSRTLVVSLSEDHSLIKLNSFSDFIDYLFSHRIWHSSL